MILVKKTHALTRGGTKGGHGGFAPQSEPLPPSCPPLSSWSIVSFQEFSRQNNSQIIFLPVWIIPKLFKVKPAWELSVKLCKSHTLTSCHWNFSLQSKLSWALECVRGCIVCLTLDCSLQETGLLLKGFPCTASDIIKLMMSLAVQILSMISFPLARCLGYYFCFVFILLFLV